VVNRPPLFYPADALQRRVEGQVVVELSFGSKGEIVDSRVLSGREELRLAAMQTALQGKYEIDSERTLQVIVDFKLPAAGQRGAVPTPVAQPRGPRSGAQETPRTVIPNLTVTPTEGGFTQLTGSVVERSRPDVAGTGMPGVTITATRSTDGAAITVLTDARGEYQFPNLPAGTYAMKAEFPGFRTQSYNTVPLTASQLVRFNFGLVPDTGQAGPALPPAVSNAGAAPARIRIGGNVAAANLLKKVDPKYSGAAGTVILEADINKEGKVVGLNVMSGDPGLATAAMEAVRQWEYKPLMLNNQPVDIVTTITVNFQ
jgi:TonB family protein